MTSCLQSRRSPTELQPPVSASLPQVGVLGFEPRTSALSEPSRSSQLSYTPDSPATRLRRSKNERAKPKRVWLYPSHIVGNDRAANPPWECDEGVNVGRVLVMAEPRVSLSIGDYLHYRAESRGVNAGRQFFFGPHDRGQNPRQLSYFPGMNLWHMVAPDVGLTTLVERSPRWGRFAPQFRRPVRADGVRA